MPTCEFNVFYFADYPKHETNAYSCLCNYLVNLRRSAKDKKRSYDTKVVYLLICCSNLNLFLPFWLPSMWHCQVYIMYKTKCSLFLPRCMHLLKIMSSHAPDRRPASALNFREAIMHNWLLVEVVVYHLNQLWLFFPISLLIGRWFQAA